MCIIAIKPSGVAMPDKATISSMWSNNPDGAGFMYAYKGRVYIEKGFMKKSHFDTRMKELEKTLDLTSTPFVLHFRITTHGGTRPENCHPFPIVDNAAMLKKPRWTTDIGVAHNGIIPIRPRSDISDTMEYIISQLACIKQANRRFYRSKHLMRLIANTAQSKLAFLAEDGEAYTVGEFTEVDGMRYSNTSYMPRISFSALDTSISCKGFYSRRVKPLMFLEANRTPIGVRNTAGDFLDADDFAIDASLRLYRVDADTGCAYICDSARIIGAPAYNEEFAENMACYAPAKEIYKDWYYDADYSYGKLGY